LCHPTRNSRFSAIRPPVLQRSGNGDDPPRAERFSEQAAIINFRAAAKRVGGAISLVHGYATPEGCG
jgi:hypothetical protein